MLRLTTESLGIRFLVSLIIASPLLGLIGAPQSDQTSTANAVRVAGSTYFTTKMENLTEKLKLNSDQQAKLKPIAEQEVGYLDEIHGNPVLSKHEKIKKLKAIVHNSDTEMKPILSLEQWQTLQNLRKEQEQELKKYADAGESHSH
jgi:hypothetical protein